MIKKKYEAHVSNMMETVFHVELTIDISFVYGFIVHAHAHTTHHAAAREKAQHRASAAQGRHSRS